MFCNRNVRKLNLFSSIDWRASLVPAAAVIPAPTVYINTAAVETLVVGNLLYIIGLSQWSVLYMNAAFP